MGSLLGLEGYITAIHDNLRISVHVPQLDEVINILESELKRKFKPGDFVRVLEGIHCDKSGFIMLVDEGRAWIYQPRGAGDEVSHVFIDGLIGMMLFGTV